MMYNNIRIQIKVGVHIWIKASKEAQFSMFVVANSVQYNVTHIDMDKSIFLPYL